MMTELLTRLRFLFSPHGRGELDEEFSFHFAQSIAKRVAAGMAPDEARRQAMVEFGGVERTREQCYEQRPAWWMGTVAQDARYAVRGFRRNPLFTATIVATLALGIGATTAVFSVVDRILFRPLPYARYDRIVSIGTVHSLERQEFVMEPFYFDWLDNQRPFESIAGQGVAPHGCDLVEMNPARLNCLSFQAGLLPLLGISPALGRNFLREEDRPNGPRVVLISYGLWLDHYDRNPGILGRMIDIDGSPARVVGVLPKDFQFPTLQSADVIFPMGLNRAEQHTANGGYGYPMRCFARLKPGVSIAQARAQMQPLYQAEQRWFPAELRSEIQLSIRSLRDRETADVRLIAWILLGSVLAVLLIAGANVAGLMMARGAARERELAVRSALGATRARLIRQTLTEALLLSIAGCTAGLALAEGLLHVFIAIAPTSVPFLAKAQLDLRIALFTGMLSLVYGAAFGLLPALQKPGSVTLGVSAAKSRDRASLRRGLVVGQIAVSMVLLSAAALLLRSFRNIEEQNLGMQAGGVITAQIALPGFRYDTGQKQMDFYLRLESALRRLPGIRAVAISDSVPPGGWQGGFRYADLAAEGKPRPAPGTGGTVTSRNVTPDYFRALNIPVIRGRVFSGEDRTSSQLVVVLSRLMAARLFPGEDPIGKRIQIFRDRKWFTVIGVAENVKNSGLMEQNLPEIYHLRRDLTDDWAGRAPVLIIDSILPERAVAPWIRSQIAATDPTVPVEIEGLAQTVNTLADRPRFEAALLGFFAFTGLVLAVIGLYGVIAFMAAQRTQEIGVRMALGATQLGVMRLISVEGLRLVVAGAVLGLAAALTVARLLTSLLYDVKPDNPVMYAAAALLLASVALPASLIPARAAMKVDPIEALRYE
jgi:putative ABC transport system permease protein